jgi:hypothetical protein
MNTMHRVLICVGVVVVGFSAVARAEDPKTDKQDSIMTQKDMNTGGMAECGMMGPGKMMGMCPMMMGKSMVASSDGGVIVLAGNKLQKYDKDLMLIKEVEIKMDMSLMQKKMMEMKGNDAMMGDEMKDAPAPAGEPKTNEQK